MKTFEHTPTGIRVTASDVDHACELIEMELVDDATRANGQSCVVADDVEELE